MEGSIEQCAEGSGGAKRKRAIVSENDNPDQDMVELPPPKVVKKSRSMDLFTSQKSETMSFCGEDSFEDLFGGEKENATFAKKAVIQISATSSKMDSPLQRISLESNMKNSRIQMELFTPQKSEQMSFCGEDSFEDLFGGAKENATIAKKAVMPLSSTTTKMDPPLQRISLESNMNIIKAIQKSDQEPNLIGDYSRKFSLPLERGKHADLKNISAETLAKVLRGEYKAEFEYTIVDCRFAYEYEGGHIKGAKNISTEEGILKEFFPENIDPNEKSKLHIIVFHCEFSSKRGPKLYRFLRNRDRKINRYPALHHPEMYMLYGGYKEFYEKFKVLCEPQTYLPMHAEEYTTEMRKNFQLRSKSWSGRETKPKQNSSSNRNLYSYRFDHL